MKSITEQTEKTITLGEEVFLIDPEDFQIDESRLSAELCNIAQLLMSYGHIEARAKLAVGQAEADLEFISAKSYNDAVIEARATGEKRTVDQLKNAVLVDDNYRTALEYLNFATEQHARARWAVIALQQKSEALRTVAWRDNKMSKFDE